MLLRGLRAVRDWGAMVGPARQLHARVHEAGQVKFLGGSRGLLWRLGPAVFGILCTMLVGSSRGYA